MALKENVKNNPLVISLSKIRSSELFWVISFTVLTFLAAQVEIPTQPVPFTLQTMLVLLAGAFLGSRNGAYSQIVYLALGVIGIPVFAGFSFGLAKIFGPTGGYLLSFPFAAYLVGYIVEKKNGTLALILSFVLGQLLILFVGAAFLAVFMNGDFSKAMFSGVVIFSVWDIIKISAAVSIYKAVSKKYPKLP
ncbi:MAG: biotin transporter BioY [Bacteroidetes bacterium]|nr:biotin transporter BioY [Bacteroidota bacterium]